MTYHDPDQLTNIEQEWTSHFDIDVTITALAGGDFELWLDEAYVDVFDDLYQIEDYLSALDREND